MSVAYDVWCGLMARVEAEAAVYTALLKRIERRNRTAASRYIRALTVNGIRRTSFEMVVPEPPDDDRVRVSDKSSTRPYLNNSEYPNDVPCSRFSKISVGCKICIFRPFQKNQHFCPSRQS